MTGTASGFDGTLTVAQFDGAPNTGFSSAGATFDVKGFSKSDILRYGQLETVGRGKYLIKVGDAYLQGKSGPFVLTLPQPSAGAAIGGVGPR